jgi:hypothetical protein
MCNLDLKKIKKDIKGKERKGKKQNERNRMREERSRDMRGRADLVSVSYNFPLLGSRPFLRSS